MRVISYEIYCYSCHCDKCRGRDLYVGKAKYGAAHRHKQHLACSKSIVEQGRRGIAIDHLIAVHGVENVRIRTIETCSNSEDLNEAEIRLIQKLKTSFENGGMNFHRGGRGGRLSGSWKPTPEQARANGERLQEANRRWRLEHPEESRDRIKRVVEMRGDEWLQKLKEGVKKVPHDVRVAQTKAGWVTRRLRKAQQKPMGE